MLFQNVSGQGVYLFAWDPSANAGAGGPKTGDASNITGYASKDGGAAAAFGTTNPTEISAAHQPGVYWQPLTQGETNGKAVAYAWTSTTSGIQIDPILGLTQAGAIPQVVAGVANGLTIAGTNAATSFATGSHFIGTVDVITTYTSNTPQTGDAFARLGAAGAGLTALGDTRVANLDAAVSTRTKPADTQAAVTTVTTLASGAITEASITVPTETTGPPAGILQMILWIAGHFGLRKVIKDSGALTIVQKMADDTTTKTTSAYTSTGGVDTIGKAT